MGYISTEELLEMSRLVGFLTIKLSTSKVDLESEIYNLKPLLLPASIDCILSVYIVTFDFIPLEDISRILFSYILYIIGVLLLNVILLPSENIVRKSNRNP